MNLQTEEKNRVSISNKLTPFVDSLQAFIGKYEDIMVKISGTLPDIEKQIDDNILEARELLNFLFSSSKETEAYGVKREISKFHSQLDSILKTLNEMNKDDKEILTGLKESIDVSNNTVDEMSKIYEISENLKVYAINSIVNAQKAGDSGRGYQIISSEFIKLSEQIAAGTKKISGISSQLQNEITDFLNAVEILEKFSEEHINNISTSSSEILKMANQSIKNFSEILDDLLNRIENSKSPTYKIMVELQKQDIIHQQLMHLVTNIDDLMVILENNSEKLDKSAGSMSETELYENRSLYTLMLFLIENTEHQINRISTEFLEMVENIEKEFSQMDSSLSDINSDKTEFSSIVVFEEQGCKDLVLKEFRNNSVIGYIFDSPCLLIKDLNENIRDLQKQKGAILKLFFQLERKIEDKKNNALTFLPVIDAIQNLLLLSRIEQARYKLDFSIAGTGREDRFFHDSFEELTTIISDIDNAHGYVIENFDNTREAFSEQEGYYREMEEEFTESVDVLQRAKNIFLDHFDTIMNITGSLVDEISNYTSFLNELRKMNDEIGVNISICTEVKNSINSRLNALGGALPLDKCHFKDLIYQKIVQKCTVAQERETISENFSGFEIEESSGNSITLF